MPIYTTRTYKLSDPDLWWEYEDTIPDWAINKVAEYKRQQWREESREALRRRAEANTPWDEEVHHGEQ